MVGTVMMLVIVELVTVEAMAVVVKALNKKTLLMVVIHKTKVTASATVFQPKHQ